MTGPDQARQGSAGPDRTSNDSPYTLDSAMQAGAEDRLAEWACEFLASPGSDNAALAAALAYEQKWWLGPVRVDLDELLRMAGPEVDDDNIVVAIDALEWERGLGAMGDSLARGWEPPPILVSAHGGALRIEDGNHRHEALRRAGHTHAWAIVWFDDEADRTHYLETRQ